MDANTVLTVWLILSGLGHLTLMAVVWNNPTLNGMRLRRLLIGASCWYLAAHMRFSDVDGLFALFVAGASWFIAVAGTCTLVGSYVLYRIGRDLD